MPTVARVHAVRSSSPTMVWRTLVILFVGMAITTVANAQIADPIGGSPTISPPTGTSPANLGQANLGPANLGGSNFGPAALDPAAADAFAANNFGLGGGPTSDLGVTRDSFSSSPLMIGDTIGGQVRGFRGATTITRNVNAFGTVLTGADGAANSTLGFSNPNNTPPDFFSVGNGRTVNGSATINRFDITEPLPTSGQPGSPGAGFVYDGGTATLVPPAGSPNPNAAIYTNGSEWFLAYSYTGGVGGPGDLVDVVSPGPGVAVRRIKISENYSPDVRDRLYLNYSFFNNVQGGLGDVSRISMGMERIFVEDLISVEYRLPVAGTFGNRQVLGEPERRDLEIGDAAIIPKAILLRNQNWLWTAGTGFTIPLASDTSLISATGEELLRVENETFHIQPFTGLLYRPSDRWAIQGLFQMDFAIGGDPVFGNLTGGRLPELGEFRDSTLASIDLAATRMMYRGDRDAALQSAFGNMELHYTATTESSDFVQSGDLSYGNLSDHFNILNLTTGAHLVFANDLVLSPAVSVPLRDGTDEQFDYEAIVQLNYYR